MKYSYYKVICSAECLQQNNQSEIDRNGVLC